MRHFILSCKTCTEKVVYVSCNPETLARDLKYLTRHGYQAVECQPCDMFPFTKHVEAICLCQRNFDLCGYGAFFETMIERKKESIRMN